MNEGGEAMIENLTSKIIQWRWIVAVATLGAALLAMMGLQGIYFESDYRIYFPEDNPQRVAHEDMQGMFSKNDNILFVLKSEGGDITSSGVLEAVFELTMRRGSCPFLSGLIHSPITSTPAHSKTI